MAELCIASRLSVLCACVVLFVRRLYMDHIHLALITRETRQRTSDEEEKKKRGKTKEAEAERERIESNKEEEATEKGEILACAVGAVHHLGTAI